MTRQPGALYLQTVHITARTTITVSLTAICSTSSMQFFKLRHARVKGSARSPPDHYQRSSLTILFQCRLRKRRRQPATRQGKPSRARRPEATRLPQQIMRTRRQRLIPRPSIKLGTVSSPQAQQKLPKISNRQPSLLVTTS